ncbi:hypothetical protein ACGVWS_05930 [Enterobacteriaceae bacterium LUAb1]
MMRLTPVITALRDRFRPEAVFCPQLATLSLRVPTGCAVLRRVK